MSDVGCETVMGTRIANSIANSEQLAPRTLRVQSAPPQGSPPGAEAPGNELAPSGRRPWARWLNLPIVALVRAYQVVLSPLMAGHCRFVPTCSEYALEACRVHPPHRALWLILRRLGRCQPWGGAGGWDPVPGRGDSEA